MSYSEISGVKSYYQTKGQGKHTVILLHGWGQNTEMMIHIENHLAQNFEIYNLDFPGFGQSDTMALAWNPDDYVLWLRGFIETMEINKPIIIGHSFGGNIAMRYASKYDVYKLVLTGSAGLKPKRGMDYYAKVYSYKMGKKIMSLPGLNKYKDSFNKNKGSVDYQNASGVMKETFVKIVNSSVNDLLSDIKCSTLLVYGDQDDATPLWMGKYLEEHLPNAGLVVFEGQDHYAYYVQKDRFNLVLDAFFKEDIC